MGLLRGAQTFFAFLLYAVDLAGYSVVMITKPQTKGNAMKITAKELTLLTAIANGMDLPGEGWLHELAPVTKSTSGVMSSLVKKGLAKTTTEMEPDLPDCHWVTITAEGQAIIDANAPAPVKKAPVKKAEASAYPADAIVSTLVDNPKRKGSASHARFALYKSGMTVAAALEAGVRSADLKWDLAHNFITICN